MIELIWLLKEHMKEDEELIQGKEEEWTKRSFIIKGLEDEIKELEATE